MKTMTNINKNKKKTFLTKFLLATSSIGLLASTQSFAVDIVANAPISETSDMLHWRHNGAAYLPRTGDNVTLTGNYHS